MKRTEAVEIARQAWAVKPGKVQARKSMRIPADLKDEYELQSTDDRGSTWADGYQIRQQILILWNVLRKLSGKDVSILIDKHITLLVGSQSFQGETQVEALIQAIAYYLPQEESIEKNLSQEME